MMKKTITFILALVLMVSLAACGGATENSADSTATDSGAAAASTTADEQPAQEEEQPQEDFEKLIAEEKERMALEEEARLAALPKLPNLETGEYDLIEFGGYEWRVLDVVDDRVLLISDKILFDAIANPYFSSITQDGILWEKWELRAYLNGEFYDSFSTDDKAKIVTVSNKNRFNYSGSISDGADTQDNIFLLSREEVAQYFSGENDAANTNSDNLIAYHVGGTFTDYDYDNNMKEYTVEPGAAHSWYLRSPGQYDYGAAYVGEDGIMSTRGQPVAFGSGIRPALWVRILDTSDVADRTVTVLPSATNDLTRLSAGDTASTDADTMELLLNSQSVLKMDKSTDVTVEKLGTNNLSLNVKSGAVLVDITRLRDDDKYEITVGDMTLSVKGTQFAVENKDDMPRIIMLEGSVVINREIELAAGDVAAVINDEVRIDPIFVEGSYSVLTLEGIMANIDTLQLPTEEQEKAKEWLQINKNDAESTREQSEPSTSTQPLEAPNKPTESSIVITDGEYEGERDANGLRSGYGVWSNDDYWTYEGYWQNDMPNGSGTLTGTNGSQTEIYEGEFIDGFANGSITYTVISGGTHVWVFEVNMGYSSEEIITNEQGIELKASGVVGVPPWGMFHR